MTVERMIELLETEKECVLRNASGECNRYCAGCDLLQDDTKLHEMYTEVIALLKAQEPVEPTLRGGIGGYWYCGACNYQISRGDKFCRYCGQAVKWE